MKTFFTRFLNLFFGTFLYALGIVVSIMASIGYAPWEVFHVGLAHTVGLSIGAVTIIVGIIILIFVTACGEKIGVGAIFSLILTGVFIDLLMAKDLIPKAESFALGLVMLLTGLFIIALGSYFYMKSAFGVGPRDNLMVVMNRKTKLPIGLCRSIVELTVTLAGWVLGGMVGIGTLISVLGIGVFIQTVFTVFRFDPASVEHETITQTYRAITKAYRK